MGAWQTSVVLAILNDIEFESLQAIHRSSVTASRESQQLAALLIAPLIQYNLPKPLDDSGATVEATCVEGAVAQLLEVELLLTADESLDLLVVEQALHDEHVDHPCESFLEGGKLSFALLLELEVNVESNELCRSVLGDIDVCTVLLKLFLQNSSKRLNIDGKGATENIFHPAAHLCLVPVEDHLQRLRRLWLPLSQIVQVWLLIDQHFVAGTRERQVYECVVVHRNTHQVSDQLEVDVGLHGHAVEVVQLHILVVLE